MFIYAQDAEAKTWRGESDRKKNPISSQVVF